MAVKAKMESNGLHAFHYQLKGRMLTFSTREKSDFPGKVKLSHGSFYKEYCGMSNFLENVSFEIIKEKL